MHLGIMDAQVRAMTRGCLCTRIRKSRVELLCEQKSKMRPVFVYVPGLSITKMFYTKCALLHFHFSSIVPKMSVKYS